MKQRRGVERSHPSEMAAGTNPAATGWGNAAAQDLMRAANGVMSPAVGLALEACFGPAVAALGFDPGTLGEVGALGAEAFTEGDTMNLGGMFASEDDLHAVEVLAHETAHALAAGSGEGISTSEDLGEQRADVAGRTFRRWVGGGMSGPAPRIAPATGGRAAVYRFESAEHVDAVDGATARLRESSDPELQALADQAGPLMDPERKITLGNGLELTPGEITALMGDQYGVFDADGRFDAGASFAQLWEADPDEMNVLLDLVHREQEGEEIAPEEWVEAGAGREGVPLDLVSVETGEESSYEQLDYLELAKRNANHFSGPTMEGTDNNMGTYAAFHEMALLEAERQAALPPEQRDLDKVRALEASAMHYVTDRHASGHQFQKQPVMDAGYDAADESMDLGVPGLVDGAEGAGTFGNLAAKAVHDQWNAEGRDVTNAEGESWRAYGDGYWDDERNAENRTRTARSVGASYAEVQAVLDGDVTEADAWAHGYAANHTVPGWSREAQLEATGASANLWAPEVMADLALQYKVHPVTEEMVTCGASNPCLPPYWMQ